MAINLTQDQLNTINKDFINKAKPNYAGMYNYIFKTFRSQMPPDQAYWFQQAAQINDTSKRPTQSAYFIQQIKLIEEISCSLDEA